MTACGDEPPCTEHTDTDDNGMCDKCNAAMLPEGPKTLNVTFTVKDHEGDLIGGVTVTLTERGAINGEGAVSATGGADGKFTLSLKEGTYLVSADYNADEVGGYYALQTTEVTVKKDTAALDIVFEDTTPNGSESRPYPLSVGENELTVPAGQSVYYILYRAYNLRAIVSSADIKIEYAGKTLTPDAENKISFDFEGEDHNSVANLKITSTGAADADVSFLIEAFPGTLGNPHKITNLGETVTSEPLSEDTLVYYTYTADKDGMLTLDVKSADTVASMQNNSVSVSTDSEGSMTISLEVKEGDNVIINLATSVDGASVSFDVSLTDAAE
jgi:hypothetical protein